MSQAALMKVAATKEVDPTSIIEDLGKKLFPEDEMEKTIKIHMDSKLVTDESAKDLSFVRDKDGSIKLKIS